ncbi:MAG TPA: substrate-binding protein [Caulobacteraceae bacterium]|nr:substrate-binding protein [Caulobacteraceae bacterium]
MEKTPIKVGMIAELTGPLSFMGLANANVAAMAVEDINAQGGLLGRRLDLVIEDGETTDSVAAAAAAKLVGEDKVDVLFGGIFSSTRQAIKGPAVEEGETLYIYPEQYEGREYHPLLFCTGPVPSQQVEPLVPWLMRETGAKKVWLPAADYIWPRVLNERAREVVAANGGTIVGEAYFPLDHDDYRGAVEAIMASGAQIVFNTTVPPGVASFLAQLHDAGFTRRGGHVITTYFDENMLAALPAAHTEGLLSCLDYYQTVAEPFSALLLARYNRRFPGAQQFTGGSACSGLWRGVKLWETAVREAGSVAPYDVAAALDHARIPEGPGGPAQMIPGQHHVRMNMYIGRAKGGAFEIVRNLGAMDPKERSYELEAVA